MKGTNSHHTPCDFSHASSIDLPTTLHHQLRARLERTMANAMRDILLSGTAGFLASCAGGFAVHRAMWKAADEEARQLDELVGRPDSGVPNSPTRQPTESFERYIARRASQWWNSGVDNVHGRLQRLPNNVGRIVDDVKSANKSEPSEQA